MSLIGSAAPCAVIPVARHLSAAPSKNNLSDGWIGQMPLILSDKTINYLKIRFIVTFVKSGTEVPRYQ